MKTLKKRGRTKPRTATVVKKKSSKPKNNLVFTFLAVGAAGVLTYLAWQYVRKRKSSGSGVTILPVSSSDSISPVFPVTDTTNTSTIPIPTTASTSSSSPKATTAAKSTAFPLKKGSKGDFVKQLQQALISKYGKSILPKYGADGDFGSETVTALKTAGLPASIDESTFHVFVQGSGGGSANLAGVAGKLLVACISQDFNTVLSQLRLLKSKSDYKTVSDEFVKNRLRGVHQTLVNGTLGSFSSETQKQQIRQEFLRMGLSYNGSQWSLSGIDGRQLVTKEPTTVWTKGKEKVEVPQKMILGTEVSQILDYIVFENNNQQFLVSARAVTYL